MPTNKESWNSPHHPVFVLLSLVFISLFVSLGVLMGLGKINGVDYLDVNNTLNPSLDFTVIQLVIQSIFLFIIPSALTLYIFPALRPKGYFSFSHLNTKMVSWVVLLFVLGMPIVGFLSWLNVQIPLSEGLDTLENSTNALIRGLITDTSMPVLVLLMGLLPAVGEELFFRGALQKSIENWSKNPHFAIIFTGFFFSAIHMQFAGFLPRFFLGVVLGYAYYFSEKLWVPILLHFVFNASQAVALKLSPEMIEEFGKTDAVEMPAWWVVVLSVGAFSFVFWKLKEWR